MPRLTLNVNGSARAVDVDPDTRLLWVLRETLELTGTKYGCGEGECGACTVLVDDKPVRSCTARAAALVNHRIETIESLARGDKLDRVQQSFLDLDAMQCGYCTPGMLMTGYAFLKENSDPSDDEIRHAISGNLCRCTGYVNIIKAYQYAAQKMRNGGA